MEFGLIINIHTKSSILYIGVYISVVYNGIVIAQPTNCLYSKYHILNSNHKSNTN